MNEPAVIEAIGAVRKAEAALAAAKAVLEAERSKLTDLMRESAMNLMTAKGKEHGDVTLEVAGVKLVASIDKSVSWDNERLLNIAGTLPWETASRIFKFTASVTEATYNAIPDEALRVRLQEARTVKHAPLKIKLKD